MTPAVFCFRIVVIGFTVCSKFKKKEKSRLVCRPFVSVKGAKFCPEFMKTQNSVKSKQIGYASNGGDLCIGKTFCVSDTLNFGNN